MQKIDFWDTYTTTFCSVGGQDFLFVTFGATFDNPRKYCSDSIFKNSFHGLIWLGYTELWAVFLETWIMRKVSGNLK